MNRQMIEIDISELALNAPPALLHKLAAQLEQDLGTIVSRELERRIAAQGVDWRPTPTAITDAINVTVAGRQLTSDAVGSAVADAIWGGLSR